MNKKTTISVIIPVYNGEAYIEKCINQLSQQSLQNFEAIIVDDGSTDNTAKIAKEVIKDGRIHFYKNEHSGVSKTRNYGIAKSKGEYIAFFDVDDEYDNDILNLYNEVLNKNKSDIVYMNITNDLAVGATVNYTKSEALYKFLNDEISNGCCDKLFKRELCENNFYDTSKKIFEDCLAVYNSIKKAKILTHINIKKYKYVKHENSSSKPSKFDYKFFDAIDIINYIYEDVKENNSEYTFYAYKKKCNTYLRILKIYYLRYGYKNKSFNKRIQEVEAFLKNIKKDELSKIFTKKTNIIRYKFMLKYKFIFKLIVKTIDKK